MKKTRVKKGLVITWTLLLFFGLSFQTTAQGPGEGTCSTLSNSIWSAPKQSTKAACSDPYTQRFVANNNTPGTIIDSLNSLPKSGPCTEKEPNTGKGIPDGCDAGQITPGAPTTDTYTLLAPLPGLDKTIDTKGSDALGNYINILIKLAIGVAAVMAMVMIVMGGIEYMTTELWTTKEAGKSRIYNALLGLLLAMGSWLILNTINPDLLNTNINIDTSTIQFTNFTISGPLTRTPGSASIKINFNKQAYPAAKNASYKTGIDEALILAIFSQETGSGANTGSCSPNDPRAKMKDVDKIALQKIVAGDINKVNVSCAGPTGYGGAIGYTQFLPSTWIGFSAIAAGFLGHQPDPWNVDDALMMTAVFLKNKGGVSDPRGAACKYYGCTSEGMRYADQVMVKMANIKKQIAEAIENGTIYSGAGRSF